MKIGVKVAEAMTVKPLTVGPETSISECAKRMQIQKVGSLIIADADNLVGIITEKDFVDLVLKGLDPKKTKVKDVMTEMVHTISPDDDLSDAIKKMTSANVKRLPVVNEGKLVGFLTSKDVLAIQPELMELIQDKCYLGRLKLDN